MKKNNGTNIENYLVHSEWLFDFEKMMGNVDRMILLFDNKASSFGRISNHNHRFSFEKQDLSRASICN